jgi:hypothetical protein
MDQYLADKSIRELTQETGMGEWAIRKQIQRYKNKDMAEERESQNESTAIRNTSTNAQFVKSKKSLWKDIGITIGVLAVITATYLIYMAIKEKHQRQPQSQEYQR